MKGKYLHLLGLLVFCGTTAFAQNSESGDMIRPTDLEWLTGAWKVDGPAIYESWTKIDHGRLEGKGFKIQGIDTLITETLEIVLREGNLVYLATVPTQNEGATIAFTCRGYHPEDLIFENPDHDFPAKIHYTLEEEGKLLVRLYKNEGGAYIQQAAYYMLKQ